MQLLLFTCISNSTTVSRTMRPRRDVKTRYDRGHEEMLKQGMIAFEIRTNNDNFVTNF
jgi:hypothetical protein